MDHALADLPRPCGVPLKRNATTKQNYREREHSNGFYTVRPLRVIKSLSSSSSLSTPSTTVFGAELIDLPLEQLVNECDDAFTGNGNDEAESEEVSESQCLLAQLERDLREYRLLIIRK